MKNEKMYSRKVFFVGGIYKNRTSDEYIIIEKFSGINLKYRIRFLKTGYETIVDANCLSFGYVKDYYKPSVFGVGYMGNETGKDKIKIYNLWHNMLSRCYNRNSSDYYAYGMRGITVCDRWLCFENFVKDLPYIEGFDEYQYFNNNLVLDKDLKQRYLPDYKKVYSLETCCFIDNRTNILLKDSKKYSRKFVVVDIETGNKEYIDYGILKYCSENNYSYDIIKNCLKGKRKEYKNKKFLNVYMARV